MHASRAGGPLSALALTVMLLLGPLLVPVGTETGSDRIERTPAVAAAAVDDVLPGEVVIETVDPWVDTTSDEYLTALGDLRSEQQVRQAFQRSYVGERTAAATLGDIAVTYVRSTPQDVRDVVNAAVADWNAALATSAAGPVHVSFDWVDLSSTLPGTLGFAGPTGFIRRADGLYYPVALANTLDRTDYDPGGVEIEVTISSAFYNQPGGWFVDAGNSSVPSDRLDLYATILHEVAHGLGFLGSAERRNGMNQLQSPPDKFDTFVDYQGQRLVDLPNNGIYLTSGDLWIDIGGGLLHELYAPSQFFNGSSYSHFDEVSYRNGEPGSLMTPALGSGETERVIDAPTLGVLIQTGWRADVPLVAASITDVAERSGSFDVTWAIDLTENAVPPTGFEVKAIRTSTGQQEARVIADGNDRTARLSGLTNNAGYRIEVGPLGNATSPGSDTTTLTLTPPPVAPSLVNVIGSGLSRTVQWQLTDDGGSPVTRYDVELSKNAGGFVSVGTTGSTQIPTGTLTNDVYQFRVRAVTANGAGPWGFSLPTGFTDTVVRPLPLDGEMARLYQASFARLPDPSGMAFYLDQRVGRRTLVSVAEEFLVSPEFVSAYGSLGNQAFVEQLYRNVLGREGDAGGIAFWTSELNNGRTRSSVVIEFAQSPEFVTQTGTAPVQTVGEGAIYRLYLAYFLRPADAGGAAFWNQQLQGGSSLTRISNAFSNSPEFVDRYGDLDDADFIELVYANVLTRAPDAAGRSFWLAQMAQGTSRGDVVLAFSESPEFKLRTGTTP